MEQIGREEINEHEFYIRFICSVDEEEDKEET